MTKFMFNLEDIFQPEVTKIRKRKPWRLPSKSMTSHTLKFIPITGTDFFLGGYFFKRNKKE
jgi:hypothetical protein